MQKIEIATLDHLNEFAQLFDEYRVFYRQETALDRAKTFIKDRLINQETITFLANVDGVYVGFVQLYPLYHYKTLQRQWLLSDLYVNPDYRGRGLSIQLIDRCKAYCEESDACGLLLETEKTNAVGNQLYPKCGFEVDHEHNYYNWWI